jgi:ubiquinone biosynthesis protein Coq4
MVKLSDLANKTLAVEITLSTGDKLNVVAKRYGITVIDQSKSIGARQKLETGEISEKEFLEETAHSVMSLVESWDLLQDDNQMYPLEMESLIKLPALILGEVVQKVMESLTFRK